MATIRMVLTSLRNPSMPQGLDVTNWIESINIDPNGGDTGTFSNTRNGATAELDFAGQNWTRTGSSYSGTVTSLSYGSAYIHGSLPQFTITGLNLSLAALLANKSSIMAMALAGNDIAYGSAGNDTIYTGVGNDRAYGGNGHDYIDGGAGNDRLFGQAGNDTLNGGDGNDYLDGGAGNDTIYGGDGADVVIGGPGADKLFGYGPGSTIDKFNDTVDYSASNAAVTIDLLAGTGKGGHAEGDTLAGFEIVKGSAFGDTIYGSQKNEWFYGNAGDDNLYGLGGNDQLHGGDGNDTIFGGAGHDKILGDAGNDYLMGDAGNDQIFGGAGNDHIEGGAGNDVIWGDAGDDVMIGGAGDDYIVLGEGNDGVYLGAGRDMVRFDYGNGNDTIFDFRSGEDRIDFTWTDMRLDVLQANAHDTTNGVVFELGSGSILLQGVHLNQINWQTDFLFA